MVPNVSFSSKVATTTAIPMARAAPRRPARRGENDIVLISYVVVECEPESI